MADETEIGPSGAPDRRGHPRGGSGEQSPLQARAEFLKNRSLELVVGLNRGACARGGAQHGFNRETQAACASEWAAKQGQVLSLNETIDFLRQCHRRAPFLFFNGNTFADVGRQIAAALFADLPTPRRREVMSAVAHYIAGVLDRESMVDRRRSMPIRRFQTRRSREDTPRHHPWRDREHPAGRSRGVASRRERE